MARPRKLKKIYTLPQFCRFAPLDGQGAAPESLTMSVEEYEVIRLIDVEGLNQEECAAAMEIARTTVQGLYAGARQKLGDFLVNGRTLHISGGEYRVDDSGLPPCGYARRGMHGAEAPAGHAMGRGQGRGMGRGMGRGRMGGAHANGEDSVN